MNQKENQAIDLMLEDLHTNHYKIRVTAKRLECEEELDSIKDMLIQYLRGLK